MANLITLLNLIVCNASKAFGTGLKGCILFLKKVSAIWLVPKGFIFDSAQAWNATYIKQVQAEGNLIVLKGLRTFTDNSSDDQIETLEDGTEQVTTLGLYKFLFQFINGLSFHRALSSLSGFGQYDIIFVDREGTILGSKAPNGSLKGFTLGMHQAQRLTFPTDSAAQREGYAVQLLERSELDNDMIYIQKQDDFNPLSINGVNEVDISFTTIPSDTDTTISIKAIRKQDGQAFTGADFNDFNIKVNGATANPTAGDDSATTGTYVLTTASAVSTGQVFEVSLYDNTNNRGVIDVGGDPYKSNTTTATAVA